MGAPHQPPNVNAPSGRVGEHLADLAVCGAGQTLVRVTAPVDEHQQVAVAHLGHALVQLREVRRAVDERAHQVALCPGRASGMAGVQPGRAVSPFLRSQEPPCHHHTRSLRGGLPPNAVDVGD